MEESQTEFATVLEVIGGPQGVSKENGNFIYKVGETVKPTKPFNEDWTVECTSGIHFSSHTNRSGELLMAYRINAKSKPKTSSMQSEQSFPAESTIPKMGGRICLETPGMAKESR